MSHVQDVKARLTPLGVLILLPEEIETPLKGGRGGAERAGLGTFLAAHPNGYIQLADADGTYISAVRDIGLMPLTVVHSNREAAEALAAQVTTTLHGTPVRPTPYQLFTGARHDAIPGIGFSLLLLFQTIRLIP